MGVAAPPEAVNQFTRGLLLWLVASLFLVPSTVALHGLKSVGMPAQLLGWVALLHWLGCTLRRDGSIAAGPQPARFMMGLLMGLSSISYGIAFSRPLVSLESGNANRLVYLLISAIGIALLLADGLRDMAAVRRVAEVAAYGSYFSAFIGLLQYFVSLNYNQILGKSLVFVLNTSDFGVGQFDTNIGRGFRAYGTADHAIEFAVVCSTMLPMALHLARHSGTRERRRLHTIGAATMALGTLLSISRSGIVGLVVGLVIYAWTMPRRSVANLAAAALSILVLTQVAAHGVLTTLRYLLLAGNSDPSLAHRSDNIPYILPLLKGRVWSGIGFGTYQPVVYRVLDDQYLVTLVNSGVLGAIGLALLFLAGATIARDGRRQLVDVSDRDFGQALAAGLLVLGVSAAFYDEFAFRQSALLVFVLLGLAGAYWRVSANAPDQSAARVGRTARTSGVTPLVSRNSTTQAAEEDDTDVVARQSNESFGARRTKQNVHGDN